MKTIAGAVLIVAAAIFYHARIEVEGSPVSHDSRKQIVRTCQVSAVLCGSVGLILLSTGAGRSLARHINPAPPQDPRTRPASGTGPEVAQEAKQAPPGRAGG